jgi:hypothetical protein
MKNLFVMLTFFFFGVTTYGQTPTPPTINISQNPIETVNCGPTTCFRVDPGVEHTYSVTPTSDGSYSTNNGWTRSNPTWEATANTFTPPQALVGRLMINHFAPEKQGNYQEQAQ